MTVAYLDAVVTKPAAQGWFVRNLCSTATWTSCIGSAPLAASYTATVSPAVCQNLLYWDAACTLPCTTSLSVFDAQSVSITSQVTSSSQPVTPNSCTLKFEWTNSASVASQTSYGFTLDVVACNAYSLAWTTTGFSISDQTYYVQDTTMTVTASLATQTHSCGYAITYSLLKSPALTAADNTVFTLSLASPNSIAISTSNHLKAGSYNLIYRASLTNTRTSTIVTLDEAFTVTIVDRCSTTTFTPQPALSTMTTTALSSAVYTQTLSYKDSVSLGFGDQLGLTFCGNRIYTIDSGLSPQTFLSITSGGLSSTITLLSNQLSDATFCPSCTISIKVCLVNYPTKCTNFATHATLQIDIGACVVTTYSAASYADFTYTLATTAANTPYPTFTQTPACAYTSTNTITVNNIAFPGTNLNGGTSMATIFTDDAANFRFIISDSTLQDGTNTYTFEFTSTLSSSPVVSASSTFNVILANPCLQTVIQDSGQLMTFSGSELMASPTVNYDPFTQFTNSYAGTSISTTTGCGPYTYSLTSYTGSFMVFDSATQKLQLQSISTTDSSGSSYSIGLEACLTDYPTVACYVKPITVTIADCIILGYTMTTGETALSTATPFMTYTIGATALVITLPTFTQSPLCDYVETKGCYLNSYPTPCPSWVTATQTTWTIQCTTPATCTAGNYNLVLKTVLNNVPASSVTQTQTVTIIDPCTLANGNTLDAGTVNSMATSALQVTAVTQTLTYVADSASTNSGVASMCGPSTFSLVAGTYSPTYLSLSGTTLTLLSTSLADIGTHNNVQVKQCLSTPGYTDVCQIFSFSVTVTACEVTAWTPVVLVAQIKYINDPSSTSGFTTWTQMPACGYSYSTIAKLSGSSLAETLLDSTPLVGVSESITGTTLAYQNTAFSDVGVYTLTWVATVTGCTGLCTIPPETSSLEWKHPCQKTVLGSSLTLPNKSTTALGSPTSWTFSQLTDTISTANGDGVSYCGARTYTFGGQGSWLTFTQGAGTLANTLVLQSLSLADYSAIPYTVTLTVSLPAYPDVVVKTFTFEITINLCVLTSLTVTGTISTQTYIIGAVQQTVAFPTYTQTPACNYAVTYTFERGTGTFVTSDTLMSVASQTQFSIGQATDTTLSGSTSITYLVTLKALIADPSATVNTGTTFNVIVLNPCASTSWISNTISVAPIPRLQVVNIDITTKDLASSNYGNMDGVSLCGLRSYSWYWISSPWNSIVTQITTTKTGDTLKLEPTQIVDQGTYTLSVTACLTSYIASCYTRSITITIDPCQVLSSTKTGGTVATINYTPFSSGTVSQNFPTYTQTPACGYTWVYTLKRQDDTSLQTIFTQTTSPGYSIISYSIADAGIYPLKLSMSLASYPAIYTAYSDTSLTWTITVLNPCSSATLSAFTSNFDTMETSVGTAQYQQFAHPKDSFSSVQDISYNYYAVQTPYTSVASLASMPALPSLSPSKGTNICGTRQYTITPATCQAYLAVDTASYVYPILILAPTLASQVTTGPGVTCTVKASLPNFPTIFWTNTVQVKITACVLTSISLATTPPPIAQYYLMGSALSISFPTYTQSPACYYPATYTCNAETHTSTMQSTYPASGVGGSIPSPTGTISAIPALANTVTCDTTNLKVIVDIKTFVPTLTDLTSYQYQGDYNLRVAVTISGITATNYVFQLRIINPCWSWNTLSWSPVPSSASNYLIASPIANMYTSVLLASQPIVQTWSAFQNKFSQTTGNLDGLTMCGARTYSILTPKSWLTMTNSAVDPNSNFFSVNSITPFTDVGNWAIFLKGSLVLYPNITTTTSFTVYISPCVITAFSAPTLVAQSYEIFTDPLKTIAIPAYTQVPACQYPVTYTSKVQKTADANVNRPSLFPNTITQYSIDSTGIPSLLLYFIKLVGSSFYVFTDELRDGGAYTIYVTATVIETIPQPALDTNADLSFQLNLLDPCLNTLVNNIVADPTLNRVSTTIETSVKYGGASSFPFGYISVQYQFYTFMDSVSVAHTNYMASELWMNSYWTDTEALMAYSYPYTSTSSNSAGIYCGPRTYVLGGAGSPQPPWLTFDQTTGKLIVQTDDDAMINYSPGHLVTLHACLQYYPTVCSSDVTYTVVINECQIVSFVNDSPQPNVIQSIFDLAVTNNIVSYTQTPSCGWALTYTAMVSQIALPFSGTSTTLNQAVVVGSPVWASLDSTPTSPKWTFRSEDYLDATTFTITQIVTLDNKLKGVLLSRTKTTDFTVKFQDPCLTSSFVLQSGSGQTFDSSSNAPLIRTSVLFGTDNPATPAGAPVPYQFDFHHDLISDNLPVSTGPSDSSNWVCGPRTYSAVVTVRGTADFMSVVDSPTASTVVKPILNAMTSLASDEGTWQITLTVKLSRYLSVMAIEKFYVMIDQCILNTLTENPSSYIRSPASSPTQFLLYANYLQQVPIPSYTQAPLCGYPLSYQLTQIQTWSKSSSAYDTTPVNCPFAVLNSVASPSFINFKSETWTDDQCDYGVGTTCDLTISYPYLLMLTAYIKPSLIRTSIAFPTTANTDEQFYVLPQDPCYATTLFQESIPTKSYFLGDVTMKIVTSTTKDVVSKDPFTKYLVDGSGYDRCGPRTYQLFTSANALVPFATIPLQQDPPIISVYTKNAANVGLQSLVLVAGLVNYPSITASLPFTLMIYNFKIGKAITLQYYQITKPALILTWAPFTISPPPPTGTMFVSYLQPEVISQKTGELVSPTPAWLSWDTTARFLKVYTNSFADQGVYDIEVYGTVAGFTYKQKQIITVNITKTPPPQLSSTPPNFTLPLVNQEFKMTEGFSFTLPATYSVGGFAVKASMTQGPRWLIFDSKTLTFTVKQGSTKRSDTGEATILVTLQDTAGGKGVYNFKLTCIPPPIVVPVVLPTASIAYPIPKITKITNKGVVTVVWDQQMRIPRNLTQVSNGTCSYIDPKTQKVEKQPNLEVEIMRGNGNERKDLSFTWNFTSWDTKAMTIQLYFETPEDISYGVDPEKLKLIFYGMSQFISQSGIPVNGGRDYNRNSIPVLKIPPQIPINQAPIVRRNNKAGMSTGQIGPMIVQLGISALLNSVWGMVDTQQIIILLPLFNIVLPDNAQAFFAQLMTIAAFAIIPTDPIFGWMFAASPDKLPAPLSDNFMAVGFATTYITNNMGTLFFSLMYFPIMVCVYYVIKRLQFKQIMRYRVGLGRKLFWSNTYQTFSDQYTIISTCALIQLAYLDWSSNYGTRFCSFLGCVYTGVAVALPFVVAFVCWKNYELIKSGEKVFKQRFSSLWQDLSTEDRGFIVYHWYFLIRRFIIGVLCVFCRHTLFFQISGLVFNIIFGVIIAGNTLCMEDKRLNTIEYFNETIIMMVMYCLICFTDFVPDQSTKSSIGLACQGIVIFHILFNLSFLFGDYILKLKLRYKQWAMYRKYAKAKALHNVKLQKQLRHQRFVQHMKRNLEIQANKNMEKLQLKNEDGDGRQRNFDSPRSYEYAQHQSQASNNFSFEQKDSAQNLNQEDHQKATKGLSRQPAEAPEINVERKIGVFDNVTTFDLNQNLKLRQQRPIEFPRDMETQTHKKLVQNHPYDSIYPDIQAMMNEGDIDDNKELSKLFKLRCGPIDPPIALQSMDPLMLLHNKLARMVQHDVSLGSFKIQPETVYSQGLKVMVDTDAIHEKLFSRMEAGDGPKQSGSERFKRQQISKRKQIITDKDMEVDLSHSDTPSDSQADAYGQNRAKKSQIAKTKAKIPKRNSLNDLDDLIEEEKEDVIDAYGERAVNVQELNKLVAEIAADKTTQERRVKGRSLIVTSDSDAAFNIHVKLFGSKVGQSLRLQQQQEQKDSAHDGVTNKNGSLVNYKPKDLTKLQISDDEEEWKNF